MSDAKTPKKAETVSKKTEATKPETATSEAAKTETGNVEKGNTESKSADNSATKPTSSPKSTAQSSTSHFSSVSTPQYRSGWNKIFGDANNGSKVVPDEGSKNGFPTTLKILDDEIGENLRYMLDQAFNELAEKHGISSQGKKDLVRFQYNVTCEIKD